jgi:hypothetical protein
LVLRAVAFKKPSERFEKHSRAPCGVNVDATRLLTGGAY